MNKLVARLMMCGMSRDVAVFMARKYKGQEHEFELYVESVEASCEQMDGI